MTIDEYEINCFDRKGNLLKNYDILHGKNLPEKKKVIDGPDTETDDEKKQCKLCCKNMANTCYSCGHVFSCISCVNANPKKECAICRKIPTTITKFYWP